MTSTNDIRRGFLDFFKGTGPEPVKLVRGEATPLAPGMCFSDEPGLCLPGEFGIRLENCFHMTATGPRYLSQPSPLIERPFG